MPMKFSMNSTWPSKVATPETYWVVLQATTANGAAPSANDPTNGITWARADEGDYTVTFAGDEKPYRVLFGACSFLNNDGDIFGKVGTYTASTGVLNVHTYLNTGGTIASDDTDAKTLVVLLLCTNSSINAA